MILQYAKYSYPTEIYVLSLTMNKGGGKLYLIQILFIPPCNTHIYVC